LTDTTNVTPLHPPPRAGEAPSRNALRQRRWRMRRRQTVTPRQRNQDVATDSDAPGVTVTTAQMCALASRLGDGRASQDDMRMADKLIMALVMLPPADSSINVGGNKDDR